MSQSYKFTLPFIIISLSLVLNGCSTGYFDPAYKYPKPQKLPSVPEISRKAANQPQYLPERNRRIENYSPTVSTYSGENNYQETGSAVIVESQESIIEKAKINAVVDIDPFDTNSSTQSDMNSKTVASLSVGNNGTASSPAVQSLIVSAQSDLAIGKSGSAVSKLERALRIESKNPKLWSLLAKAHYDQSNFQQAINMSKKSIRYSSNDEMIASNWQLIKKAGLKSGDTVVVREAINYEKTNP